MSRTKNVRKKKMGFTHNLIIIGLLLFIISSIFILLYLSATGNDPQVYHDIIMGGSNGYRISNYSSNKINEMHLLYILIFGGVAFIGLYCFYLARQSENKDYKENTKSFLDTEKVILIGLCTLAATYYVVYGKVNQMVIMSLFYTITLFIVDKALIKIGLYFYYTSVYGFYAIYRLYVWLGGDVAVNETIVAFVSLLFSFIVLLFEKRRQFLSKGILLFQLCMPCLLLICTQSKYYFEGNFVTVSIPARAKYFIGFLILLFLAEALSIIKKSWKTPKDISSLISLGGCVSIMAFNRFSGLGSVVPKDMHDPFENVISWYQIFEQGQKPFESYIPIQGLFGIIHGAVFDFFGNHGELTNYYLTQNIFYLLVIILTIALLHYHIDRKYIFLIALCFQYTDYNRPVFIIPVMLILTLPKLLENKNLWLKIWLLTSFFHGLYYPTFGAAVCIGFLPLGIWQFITYVRSKEFQAVKKKISFWIWWIICLIPVLCGIPLLFRMYKHIKIMSGQTLYADGLARFGSLVPDDFFAYLSDYQIVRIAMFYILTFMIPVSAVWISTALFLKKAKVRKAGKLYNMENPKEGFIFLSLAIMCAVSYSSTFMRSAVVGSNEFNLLNRGLGVLIADGVLLMVFTFKYISHQNIKYAVVCFSFFVPVILQSMGFAANASKLRPYYTVPDNYTYVENKPVEKLGKGFVDKEIYDEISESKKIVDKYGTETAYFMTFPHFGHWVACEARSTATIEAGTLVGYDSVKECVDVLKKEETVIGTKLASTSTNYYLFHWLMTSGDYVYSKEDKLFLPNKGKYTPEQVSEMNKTANLYVGDVRKYAATLGSSMDTLSDIFSSPEVEFNVNGNGNAVSLDFQEKINGDTADFIYLEFAGMDKEFQYALYDSTGEKAQKAGKLSRYLMKKNYNPEKEVILSWIDETGETCSIRSAMSEGKLLIPLGAGKKWLLYDHDNIKVSVEQNGKEVPVSETDINEIKMLKLREVD